MKLGLDGYITYLSANAWPSARHWIIFIVPLAQKLADYSSYDAATPLHLLHVRICRRIDSGSVDAARRWFEVTDFVIKLWSRDVRKGVSLRATRRLRMRVGRRRVSLESVLDIVLRCRNGRVGSLR